MLPSDEKKNQFAVATPADDLMTTAKKRCMSRLISAIKNSDETQALDALGDLLALNDDD